MELLGLILVLCVCIFLLLFGIYKGLELVAVQLAIHSDDHFDEIAVDEIRDRLKRAVERRRGLLENKRAVRLEAGARDLRGWESDVRAFVVAHGNIVATRREERVFDERFDEFRQLVDNLLAGPSKEEGVRS